MRKRIKKTIFTTISLVGAFLTLTGVYLSHKEPLVRPEMDVSINLSSTTPKVEAKKDNLVILEKKTAIESTDFQTASLIVEGQTILIPFKAGETLIDAMSQAQTSGKISFDGKEYTGLGFFVDTINGKNAQKGHSWILYVNGKEAQVGASTYKLNEGDLIEWKYESR